MSEAFLPIMRKYEKLGWKITTPLNRKEDRLARFFSQSEWAIIREIIQNAADEMEYVTGKPEFEIKFEPGVYIEIRDRGRGIGVHHLMLGVSEKMCWMRGTFGVGLKVACAAALLRGWEVEIYSYDAIADIPYLFKPIFEVMEFPGGRKFEFLFYIYKRVPREQIPVGTRVILRGPIYRDYRENFVFFKPKEKIVHEHRFLLCTDKEGNRKFVKNQIIDELEEGHPRIYCRDIYVMTYREKPGLFSYNIWRSEPDDTRMFIRNFDEMLIEIGNLYVTCPKIEIWEKLLEAIANPVVDYFESHLEPNTAYFENLPTLTKERVRKAIKTAWVNVHGKNAVLTSGNSAIDDEARGYGARIVNIPRGWREFLAYVGIKDAWEYIEEHHKERKVEVPIEELTEEEQRVFELFKTICTEVANAFGKPLQGVYVYKVLEKVAEEESLGTTDHATGRIGINIIALRGEGRVFRKTDPITVAIAVAFHELAHWIKNAPEIPQLLHRAISELVGEAMELVLTNPKIIAKISEIIRKYRTTKSVESAYAKVGKDLFGKMAF